MSDGTKADSDLPVMAEPCCDSAVRRKAAAWDALWTWCRENGMPQHADERLDVFSRLTPPQIVAQWILDLKSKASE